MSDSDQLQTDEAMPPEVLTPPGEQLRRAREAKGMSLEDAARELRMPLVRLRALESDDYVSLKADTFVRGYVRAYAKLLDLEAGPLLSAYGQLAGDFAGPAGSNVNLPVASPRRSPWFVAVSLALILGGLWLISVWFFGNRPEPAAVYESAPLTPEEYPVEATPGLPPEAVPADENLEEPVSDLQPLAESPPLLDTGSDLDQLHMVFSGECWVEVSDAQGDVLHTNLQQANSRLTLQGRAPFSVRMGNARVVEMQFNGEPVEIPLRRGENVVSMNVGP